MSDVEFCGIPHGDSEDAVPATCSYSKNHDPILMDGAMFDHGNPEKGVFWNETVNTQCGETREHPNDPDSIVICTLEAGHARPWVESAPGYFDHFTEGFGYWKVALQSPLFPQIFGNFRVTREDHVPMIYLGMDGHLYATCSCGQWKHKMRKAVVTQTLHAFDQRHQDHLSKLPTTQTLPDGTYFDGTYDWVKEDGKWEPLRAPSGMPSQPDITKLRRVNITREYEDLA